MKKQQSQGGLPRVRCRESVMGRRTSKSRVSEAETNFWHMTFPECLAEAAAKMCRCKSGPVRQFYRLFESRFETSSRLFYFRSRFGRPLVLARFFFAEARDARFLGNLARRDRRRYADSRAPAERASLFSRATIGASEVRCGDNAGVR